MENQQLFSNCALPGGATLKNRIVMAPMTRCFAGDELVPMPAARSYYADRADAGLIVTEATEHLVGKLYLTPGNEVLDVGCGIGGAARYIAAHCGCRVAGLDLTPEFIHSARTLTAAVGLDQRVRFDIGSALNMPYEDARFDAVVNQHVAMNIADRATLYREMARVLKPGRPLAIFDVMKKSDGELLFPVPWAESPETSHLVTPQEMDLLLADAGLQVIESEDHTPLAIRYFCKVLEQTARQASIHPAPHLSMRQSDEKLRNTLTNIERGVIVPVMMLAVRLGG